MFAGYDFDVIERSLGYLFREGMVFTLTLTALAMTGGIFFGTLLAMMRLSSMKWLSALAGGYVNLMRSIPLVLVIFWFFFLVPYIGAWLIGAGRPIAVGAFWSAAITFTMFEAAYYCEIMRAGIQSIPRGQVWSGYALGLDYWQTMGFIVLPQAFRNMIPVLLTQTIILFQDTSLVYVISATDFLGAAARSRTATTAWWNVLISRGPSCLFSLPAGQTAGIGSPSSDDLLKNVASGGWIPS
jgi:glutamate/aspartate transport system permease protein